MIENFVTDCEARGLTPHTIETYRSNVKSFLKMNPDPINIDLDGLRKYLRQLRNKNLSGSTLRGHFAAISTFYEYLIFEGLVQSNPIIPFRRRYLARIKLQYGGNNTRQLISIKAMRELLSLPARINIITMMLFLAKTGLRRGELIGMDVQDIDLEKGQFSTKPKAKRTNRLGFIDIETGAALQEYLDWREPRAIDSALWIMPGGKRVTRNYLYYSIIEQASILALHDCYGPLNKKFTPHCFRHWFTTHLFRAGMNPQYLMWLRGDSMGSQAWQLYNHIDPEAVKDEYLRCIPSLLNVDSVQPVRSAGSLLDDRKRHNIFS